MGTVCSTPVGVIEAVTTGSRPTRTSPSGAQRLSASSRRSQAEAAIADSLERCPTPAGVIEAATRCAQFTSCTPARCSTPAGVIEAGTNRPGRDGLPARCRRSAAHLAVPMSPIPAAGCRPCRRPTAVKCCGPSPNHVDHGNAGSRQNFAEKVRPATAVNNHSPFGPRCTIAKLIGTAFR